MDEKLLYVALDDKDPSRNLEMARTLAEGVEDGFGFKVNLDNALTWGLYPEVSHVQEVQLLTDNLFVDLKMFNGSTTMGAVLRRLAEMNVSHTNLWALADYLIPRALEIAREHGEHDLKVLGVTVTTRMDEEYCKRHFGRTLADAARHFSEVALNAGCDGIIIPGNCLLRVDDLDCIKLSPGIRPDWYVDPNETQKQIVTPAQAISNGADILVCGSPITKAGNPVEALQGILEEMR